MTSTCYNVHQIQRVTALSQVEQWKLMDAFLNTHQAGFTPSQDYSKE